jgi:hypothetical protein
MATRTAITTKPTRMKIKRSCIGDMFINLSQGTPKTRMEHLSVQPRLLPFHSLHVGCYFDIFRTAMIKEMSSHGQIQHLWQLRLNT